MSEFVPLEPLEPEWRVVATFPGISESTKPFPVSHSTSKSREAAEMVAIHERDHRLPIIYGKRTKIIVSIESRLVGPWGPT